MKYVLFVCTHNASRSQIAQAFFERYAPVDIRAESAGEEPATAIWPNVIEAMREVGLDLVGRRPKKLDLEMQLHADLAITLGCGGACPYVPTIVEDWQMREASLKRVPPKSRNSCCGSRSPVPRPEGDQRRRKARAARRRRLFLIACGSCRAREHARSRAGASRSRRSS